MAYKDVAGRIKYPERTSTRYKRLDGFDRLRQGTLYDHLKIPFDMESDGSTYVRIRERRPSVIWLGAKMLVDQLSGLMWGDEQMPIVRTYEGDDPSEADREAEGTVQSISEKLSLDMVMDDATDAASSGSCAIIIRATNEKQPYFDVVPGKQCKPKFDPRNPLKLVELEQLYPTTGELLAEIGYEIKDDDLKKDFWFRLTIDDQEEVRFKPMTADDYENLGGKRLDGSTIKWVRDEDNSWPHDWPVIPVLWVRSPGHGGAMAIDGACVYGSIADFLVGIDYYLSQIERGYRYTADPLLAYKKGELAAGATPAGMREAPNQARARGTNGKFVKRLEGPIRVLDVDSGGDAKWLELQGTALKAFEELIKTFREWALEIAGGMKSDAGTTKGVESGRALEILYQNLILVLKRWRVALGNQCYLPLIRLLLSAIAAGTIEIEGVEAIDPNTTLRLEWPAWMTPSGTDLLATANAAQTLAGGSTMAPVPVLPRKLVTRWIAANLGMPDTAAILEDLDKQQTDDDNKAADQADQDQKRQLELTAAKPAAAAPGKGPQK